MAQYSGLTPPSNSKLGDIYTNTKGQKFMYIKSNTGQPGRKLVKDTTKTTLNNPDFGTTIQEGKNTYGFITNPKTGQKEKVNLKYENERTQAYLEQQNKNKDAIIDSYEKGINKGGVSNNTETNTTTNTTNPKPTKKTNTSTIKTTSSTAPKSDTTQFGVAPEGWTQDEWNQSMAMYKADSEHYYDTQRNKPVGNGKTQDQVFGELYNQYATNPTSFNQSAQEQLLELSKKLGYAYGYKTGNPEAQKQREAGYTSNGIQSPAVNNVTPTQQTQTTVQRTVSEIPTVSINDQARKGFKTNDTTGYYSGQNPGIRNLYL